MVARLCDTGADDRAFVAQALLGPAQRQSQRGQVGTAEIAQLDPLEVVPDAFVRVQLGRVGGQLLQVQPFGAAFAQEVLDGLAAMDGRPVLDHQELAADLAQQQAQESDDIGRAVGVILGLHKETAVGGDPADRGEMVAREGHAQDRRLPARRPRPDRHGQQVEARLVYPDAGASFLGRFFSKAGQRSRHHAWMAAASRWLARWMGRCTLCRSACNSRLTWAGW
jgi:hypothetical protein